MVPFQVPGIVNLTGSGAVGTAGHAIRVFNIHVVCDGTASNVILKNGGTSGTATIQADGTASKGATLDFHYGVRFEQGCYATFKDAHLLYATITYTEEQL